MHMVEIRWTDGSSDFYDFTILGIARDFVKDSIRNCRSDSITCIFVTLKDGSVFKWESGAGWIALDATWAI